MSSVEPSKFDLDCKHTGKMASKVFKGKLLRFHSNPDNIFHEVGCNWTCSYREITYGNRIQVQFKYDGDITWSYAKFSIDCMSLSNVSTRGSWGPERQDIQRPIDVSDMWSVGALQCPKLMVTITEYHSAYNQYSPLPKLENVGNAALIIPDDLCDGVIMIGWTKINVNKAFLAMHSTYFKKLFFGAFAESNKNTVALKDIDYNKFMEFLRVILPERKYVTKTTVTGVLEMADFFDCESARRECALFLHGDETMSNFEKLRLADRYQLMSLENAILLHMDKPAAVAACEYGRSKYSDRLMLRLAKKIAGT